MKHRIAGIEKLRIVFISGKQRQFIEDVIARSNLAMNDLAKVVKISQRSFQDWKNERTTIPLVSARLLSTRYRVPLGEKEEVLINRWIRKISEANKKGGEARFQKYGVFATQEGRKKGGQHAMTLLRKSGLIPPRKQYKAPRYSSNLAEFVGIMLGDGGITSGQCTITLNKEADKEYINFVRLLCINLFGEAPKIFFRKNEKTACLYYYGIDLVAYLRSIGLLSGNKVKNQVDVPAWIKKNKKYSIACLRGMMDTDGCIVIHKYVVKGKKYSYKKLIFTNRSLPLITFAYNTLLSLGFTPKISGNLVKKRVWLYNASEVSRYLKVVRSSNYRLLKMESGPDGKAQVC